MFEKLKEKASNRSTSQTAFARHSDAEQVACGWLLATEDKDFFPLVCRGLGDGKCRPDGVIYLEMPSVPGVQHALSLQCASNASASGIHFCIPQQPRT